MTQGGADNAKGARWTPERDEQLRKMASEYVSATDAAKVMGISRGAVLGRAHRIGLRFLNTKKLRKAVAPKPQDDKARLANLDRILARMDAPIPKDWRPPQ